MKKEFKSMFVIGNVVCLLFFTACGGKDSSKSSNKEKAVNDNASTLSLVSGNYTADLESSSVLWECGWLGGNSHNGDVYLEEGLLSIKDNNNLTGSFLVDMTTIDCHDEKNIGTKNKIIGHLKSDDFFDVQNHPESSLHITSLENIIASLHNSPVWIASTSFIPVVFTAISDITTSIGLLRLFFIFA